MRPWTRHRRMLAALLAVGLLVPPIGADCACKTRPAESQGATCCSAQSTGTQATETQAADTQTRSCCSVRAEAGPACCCCSGGAAAQHASVEPCQCAGCPGDRPEESLPPVAPANGAKTLADAIAASPPAPWAAFLAEPPLWIGDSLPTTVWAAPADVRRAKLCVWTI